ncbi:DUF1232 domain-containing protein [Rhodocytophaga rosea]|uniref:DUF1232 domain-containing protein n=1 Tax=Rhodocytophaga rosea TaxID=2704465 RepID=A0A6C0GEH9_9BACT|nr:YkvA family protein [Rhodocytophaga rosea]QHT66317.1 DUF1232 domain-containing protein [Rhodocytophaga rosea]
MSASKLAGRVIKSVFFKVALERAVEYAKSNKKMGDLLSKVRSKTQHLEPTENNASFMENVSTLRRMVRAYKQGDYKEIPWRSLTLVLAGLLYFVSPIDFIPDLLPLVGFTDDIAVIIWVYNAIRSDIENFRQWEAKQVVPISEQS